jgi:uncharacterized membrane protein HdeD (DUF308 family)
MSSAAGSSGQSSNRTTALILLAVGVVVCIVGIVFISTNHDLRATASFIVGVLALAAGGFMLVRKPKNT